MLARFVQYLQKMSLLLGAKYKIKILWAIPITSTDKVKVFPLVKMEEKINRVCSKRGRFKAERAQLGTRH